MFCCRAFRLILVFVFCLPLARPLDAQIPSVLSPAASAPAQPAPLPDTLKRETPKGCLLGFIKAAGEERYNAAIQYFQPSAARHRPSVEDEEDLASELFTILSLKFSGPLDFVSGDPLGRLDDGLPPDQEQIGGVRGLSEDFPILLVRADDDQGRKLWYISRKTLDRVPGVFDNLQFPVLEKNIPETLVTNRFMAMPLWQWIGLLLFAPVALVLARILTFFGQAFLRHRAKRRGLTLGPRQPFRRPDPITLCLAIFIHYRFVSYIGTSILYRLYYRRLILVLIAAVFYWIVITITRAISRRVGASLGNRGLYAERSIVSLVRRFVEVVVFLFVSLTVLKSLGVDVTTALAGVGIGGLALGLGAQKTFENVFGGVSILFDKVIVVGDTCRINNQVGIVEDIGLRSTRLRTPERTLLSIPNGVLSTSTIENLRFRDKFLCQQIIRLRYDLSPDHVRYVLAEIRELLRKNPKVEDSTARVRFLRFAEYALEIEIYAYILEPDYNAYLATQEGILLQVMDELEKAGAVLALPTQTTLVTKDSWVDPEKSKAARAAIEKIRDPGVPGPGSSLPST
jgi:MscS family membrane protein